MQTQDAAYIHCCRRFAVCVFDGRDAETCGNGSADRDAVWDVESGLGPRNRVLVGGRCTARAGAMGILRHAQYIGTYLTYIL